MGAIEQWPPSLRTALDICLALAVPACVVWGRGRVQLYNDRYSQLAVNGHSPALCEDFAASCPGAWLELQPAFERAVGGEPTVIENQRVRFERAGVVEESLATVSFAPIRDDTGSVGGLFITLIDPVTAVLRTELARATADVEQYSYAISHDFRSPLRTLEQMARIVVADHGPQLPADAANLLNHVVRGAAKLADRADALSQVAQLSEQTLTRQRVDVVALVNEVVAELRSAAVDRHVEVVVGELPAVDADPALLRRAISSLLSNAFKFTRQVEHARIEVRGRRQAHQNEYSISDNGVGFDMKFSGRLFGFFQRLHAETRFEGIGVGLALAKRLIERHGGSIWVAAEHERGATFHFTLPT